MSDVSTPRGVHLVGSVPLASAEEAFRTVASGLGDRLRRIPDGETGKRATFTLWQLDVFKRHPDFERALDLTHLRVVAPYRLRRGVDPGRLRFTELGYASAAKASYEVFRRLRDRGEIRRGVPFLVSLPTPANTISLVVTGRDVAAVERAYEAALLAEVAEIVGAIPARDLAIQWDAPFEVRVWDGSIPPFMPQPWFEDRRGVILDTLVRLGKRIPEPVELGYHLCHGDYAHTGNLARRLLGTPGRQWVRKGIDAVVNELARRSVGPLRDATTVTEIASALAARVDRPIEFVHLPVPREAGDSYFAPLQTLSLQPGTELYLGLVHFSDGHAGTRRRIEVARRVVTGFGVATECGWGRREAETIGSLLQIHHDVSAPLDVRVG